jgi:hypothetical protein
MVVKFIHRRAALSSNSNGTRSLYSRENPKSSLYCDMSMDTGEKQACIGSFYSVLIVDTRRRSLGAGSSIDRSPGNMPK